MYELSVSHYWEEITIRASSPLFITYNIQSLLRGAGRIVEIGYGQSPITRIGIREPSNSTQALKDTQWCAAMVEEFTALVRNNTKSLYLLCCTQSECCRLQVGFQDETTFCWLH